MHQLSRIVAIAVLLNLSKLHDANADIKSSSHVYSYPHTLRNYNDDSFKEDIFTYTVGEKSGWAEKEESYTIIQHKFPFDKITHSCNVTLRTMYPENNQVYNVLVQPFGQESAILKWIEGGLRPSSYLMIIQLNSCKNKTIELGDPRKQGYRSEIVAYDNYFDVFFQGMESLNKSTETPIGMRVGFDRETQFLYNTNHREVTGIIAFISSVATRSPSKGYVYYIHNPKEFNYGPIVLVKPDGTEKLLMAEKKSRVLTATGHNLISSCVQSALGSHIACTQYDENGEVKFKFNLGDVDQWEYWPDVLYNTPGGGFLLKVTKFKKADVQRDFRVPLRHDLLRINSEGRKVGSISLDRLQQGVWSGIHLFKNGDQYCGTTTAEDPHWLDETKILSICFTENDFSA